MSRFDRITSDPEILNGQRCIRGMRLPVRVVLEALSRFPTRSDLMANYPSLEEEDIAQALRFGAAMIAKERGCSISTCNEAKSSFAP